MRAGEEDQFRSSGIGHGHGLSVKHHKETATAKPVSTPEPMMASSSTVLETGAIDLSEKMGYHMETTSWTLLISILVFLALRIPALFKKGEGDEQESKAKHPSKHSHN
jgi:hypothetical protein